MQFLLKSRKFYYGMIVWFYYFLCNQRSNVVAESMMIVMIDLHEIVS